MRRGEVNDMPTGPKHLHGYDVMENGTFVTMEEDCRCMIGEDHHDSDMLSADEANDIWMSSGMDEDYDFR